MQKQLFEGISDKPHDRRKENRKNYRKGYYLANRERLLRLTREWKKANKERVKRTNTASNAHNKQKINEQKRKYYAANLEERRAYQRRYRKENPEKHIKAGRKYRETHPERMRWNTLKSKYGIQASEFQSMYDAQQGKCGICEEEVKHQDRSTHLDHDHKTGKIRGILCENCNKMLGHARENPRILMAAVEYLKGEGWLPKEIQAKANC
jgi:hypothetical protein